MAPEAEKLAHRLKEAITLALNSHPPSGAEDLSPAADEQKGASDLAITPENLPLFIEASLTLLQGIEHGLLKWKANQSDHDASSDVLQLIQCFSDRCGIIGCLDLEKVSRQMAILLTAAKSGADFGKNNPGAILLDFIEVLKEGLADIIGGGKGIIPELQLHLDLLEKTIPATWLAAHPEPLPAGPSPRIGEILLDSQLVSEDVLEEALDLQHRSLGEVLIEMGAASGEEVAWALQEQAHRKKPGETPAALPSKTQKSVTRQDIRVDLYKLDTLIDLIGEMVIAENMLIHSPDLDGLELDGFHKSAQQMNKLVKELQEIAMTIRMIPVAGLFRRMTRVVHDLSRKSGKKVDLQLFGIDTELDKTVIETITDPLLHIIRNSMDHGLEPPEERVANAKPETGTLKLSARHEEGEVWITIEDDGRGLNREKIIKAAIANGAISGDETDLSDHEIANMIFLPGFSTAEKVTDISGRGVGMDVVRQNLNKINGKIDVDSSPGGGTRTNLRIPLTMAIIDGMLVRVGTTKYILPILPILESLRPDGEMITICPDGGETVMIRKKLYPVFRLHEIHKITPDFRELHKGILILLEDRRGPFCLFVDQILGQQQTVMKGISEYLGRLRDIKAVSGCTILANGEVCLILDVGGLSAVGGHRRAKLN
jgi:two-component system chemotaxis sensor kinase CheA